MSTLMEQRDLLVKEAEALAGKSADMFTAEDAARADELAAKISEISGKLKAAAEHKERIDGFLAAPKTARRAETAGRTRGERFAKAFIAATGGHLEEGQTWRQKDDPDPEPAPEPAGDGVVKYDPDVLGTYGYAKGESRFPVYPAFSVADLFGSVDISSNGVEYLRWTFKGDPETLNDGDKKTQLEATYEPVTVSITEIGAYIKVTEWMLSDEPALAGKINGELAAAIRRTEETQLLAGDGNRPNVLGILECEDIQSLEATEANLIDQILLATVNIKAMTQLDADAVVVNPADWFKIRTAKDENGQYLFGGPAFGPYGNGGLEFSPNPWGVRVFAQSTAVPEGTVLVGAFERGATKYYRTPVELAASNSNEDDFVYDRLTLRGYRRMGFGIDYPQAFVAITVGESQGN